MPNSQFVKGKATLQNIFIMLGIPLICNIAMTWTQDKVLTAIPASFGVLAALLIFKFPELAQDTLISRLLLKALPLLVIHLLLSCSLPDIARVSPIAILSFSVPIWFIYLSFLLVTANTVGVYMLHGAWPAVQMTCTIAIALLAYFPFLHHIIENRKLEFLQYLFLSLFVLGFALNHFLQKEDRDSYEKS